MAQPGNRQFSGRSRRIRRSRPPPPNGWSSRNSHDSDSAANEHLSRRDAMTAGATGLSYDERRAYLLLAPLAAVLMGVAVFPILYSFYISLYSIKLIRPQRAPFVWLDNYVAVLSDPHFWSAVERTVIFSVIAVAAILVHLSAPPFTPLLPLGESPEGSASSLRSIPPTTHHTSLS